MKRVFSAFICAGLMAAAPLGVARAELVMAMFEQAGCAYCIMWDKEIGPIWPKTAEGRTAPLRKIDLRGKLPEDVRIGTKPQFTPTFVLLRDGVEIDRLEGYPGEDFFWGLIGNMLRKQPEWVDGATDDGDEGGVEG